MCPCFQLLSPQWKLACVFLTVLVNDKYFVNGFDLFICMLKLFEAPKDIYYMVRHGGIEKGLWFNCTR